MLAAPVWHYWIGLILLVVALLGVASMIGGYLTMVSKKRYPPASRDQIPVETDPGS